MRILNEHSHWWKGEEKEWITQGKDGIWWIWRKKSKSPNMKIDNGRSSQRSNILKKEHYIIIILASALGVSMALNIVAILS